MYGYCTHLSHERKDWGGEGEKCVVFKIESGASKLREKLRSTASLCLLRNDVFGRRALPAAELQQVYA